MQERSRRDAQLGTPHVQLVLPQTRTGHHRNWRVARAIWHDTSALLREFRWPLVVLLVALFGGGWLYLQLYRGYYPDIDWTYWDMPYIMLALMVIESTHDVPPQPELILFWYAMPILAVFIIGQGALNFFRLFFDRTGRRDAWEEAVASTYADHVIVVGLGHVGLRTVRTLARMRFEVVVIDMDFDEVLDNEMSSLGVPLVRGDARLQTVLEKAGLKRASSLVVCTSDDYVNLEVTLRARDLNPDIRIVVRMWDAQFSKQLRNFMNVQAVLSASDLSAPAFAGAAVGIEIAQSLTIRGEEYSLIRLPVAKGSFMDGCTIAQFQHDNDADIVLHERGGEVSVHPAGDITVLGGDLIVMFAHHDRVVEIVRRNQYNNGNGR